MEQLVILLVIGAISLINWLLQKSAEHKKRQGQSGGRMARPNRPPDLPPWVRDDAPEPIVQSPRAGADTGGGRDEAEEQMRRFFEALGLPTPDPAQPEPQISLPFEPEPIAAPASLPEPPPVPGVKPTLRENREMRELAERFERNAIDAASDTGSTAAFRELLQNPSTVRQGIILREILGPPKALQET